MNSYFQSVSYKRFLQLFLIVLLCLVIYIPSFRNGFIWDDETNLYKSPWIQEAGGLKVIWLTNNMYQYYPVVFTTFWLEHKLWGLNPVGYHTVNLILHILNALLVFWIVSKLYPRFAFICALFFAIHPIQVETVAWVTELKNLLSLFFFLLAVLSYLRFDRTRRIRDYLFTFIMFVCAMLSKPVAICFIFFPVLYKWWRDGKFAWREIRLSIIFVLTGLIGALYTLYLEFYHVGAQGKVFALTFLERLLVSGRIIFFYIYKILFPLNFMFFYPPWTVNTNIWWQWLFPLAVVLALGALVIIRERVGRGALALFIFYIISIFPVLGFLNVYGMKFSFVADHFSYLSTPCLLLLLCATLTFFFDGFKSKFTLLSAARYKTIQRGLLSLVVIYMCSKSMLLTENYKDQITLWSNLIRKNPNAWLAYNNLANFYSDMGKKKEAMALYNRAIAIYPDFEDAYYNRGIDYRQKGNLDQAISDYNKAIELRPNFAEAYYNRGIAYRQKGNLDQAISDYNKAIELNHNYSIVYNNRGVAYCQKGDFDRAISDYSKAIEIDPNNAMLYKNRAMIYFRKGSYAKSWGDIHRAQTLGYNVDPGFIEQLKRASGKEE